MTKMVRICDCCGREVNELHPCCRELRTWEGYKRTPKKWELCDGCIELIEAAMQKEIDAIARTNKL